MPLLPWFHGKLIGSIVPNGAVEAGGDTPGHSIALSATYADGAVEAGGDALLVTTVSGFQSGAAEVGGDGTYISSVTIGADGAAEVGGDALATTRAMVPDGASEAGGDALAAQVALGSGYADGAAQAGGDAVPIPLITGSANPDGAAEAGGDAVVVTIAASRTADGAATVGGDGVDATQNIFHSVSSAAILIGGSIQATITPAAGGNSAGRGPYIVGAKRHRGQTTQTAILTALRDHLIDQGLFIDSTIWIRTDAENDDTAPVGDQYLVINPSTKSTDQAWAAGAGVEVDIQAENVEMSLYHRLSLDHLQRATLWAASRSSGAYKHARNVQNALHICDLMDRSGTVLVAEPIRTVTIGRPQNVTRKSGWGVIPITVEIVYKTDFDSVLT